MFMFFFLKIMNINLFYYSNEKKNILDGFDILRNFNCYRELSI